MDRFEEFIVKKYPNRSPKVLLQKFQDADGTWFYGVKEVQDQSEAWQARQAEIDELKDRVATYKIETYESHGRISYAHHCFMNMDRDQFYKNIEAVICGRLRHPEFSFDRSRIKALRSE
ncbi:hypothetical protein ACDW34_07105 [Acinetobacter piscicola]|uniref:hypothetical protein n=1 Tax=Acinetobacter piscicola TaxID=2006115 RepID=UPI003555C556